MDKILFFFFGILLLAACQQHSNYAVVPVNGEWAAQKKIVLETQTAGGVAESTLLIRNNNEYPYSNLRLFIDIEENGKPLGKTDTLNITLAQPNGSWLGTGMGGVKSLEVPYRTLSWKQGTYRFTIRQAMRTNSLKGIEDIGIKINSAK